MPTKYILVDCDDVLSDFKTPARALMKQMFGIEVELENLRHWDLFSVLTREQHEAILDEIGRPGVCYSFELLPGAKEGIERLRSEGTVVAVTRPVLRPTWAYERTHWLIDKLGFQEHQVINAAPKHMVKGHALVDDNPDNISEWAKHHPAGAGMMWALPNTEHLREMDHHRVRTWDTVLERVKAL